MALPHPSLTPHVKPGLRSASEPHLVVAGLLVRGGRVLLGHRSAQRTWYPDVWDIPGGHVERGETPTRALVRELREELGIAIIEPPEVERARITTKEFHMSIWLIEKWTGRAVNAAPEEHDEVSWISADQLPGLRLAHGSYLDLLTEVLVGEPDRD